MPRLERNCRADRGIVRARSGSGRASLAAMWGTSVDRCGQEHLAEALPEEDSANRL
jgi:hypothetical protein